MQLKDPVVYSLFTVTPVMCACACACACVCVCPFFSYFVITTLPHLLRIICHAL